MAYQTAAKNAALDGIGTAASWISLHTADPSTSGANEVPTGTYARKQTTWGAAASSSKTGSAVVIDVPGSTTVSHWGFWTASSGGTFFYGGTLPASEAYSSAGQYSLTPTLTASG
jgi:hypothetical protein